MFITRFVVHSDHLGSVSAATDANGVSQGTQEYDPWGAPRTTNTTISTHTALNYTGQRKDGTGLLYYHARYYDPTLGRFLSADTIVPNAGGLTTWPSDATARPFFLLGGATPGPFNPQQLNRYSYVNNNPIRHTDPTGHLCAEAVSCAAEGAVAGGAVAGPAGAAVGAGAGLLVGSAAGYYAGQGINALIEKGAETDPTVGGSGEFAGIDSVVAPAVKREPGPKADRSGRPFTPKGKKEVINKNKEANQGKVVCEKCRVETVPSQKSKRGVVPDRREAQVDHIVPESKGGAGSPPNEQVLCRSCNRAKSNSMPN